MAVETIPDRLRAALALFAARDDLTDDARAALAEILDGRVMGFGVTEAGEIALTSAALARHLAVSPNTLANWRRADCPPCRRVGPPVVEVRHAHQRFALYPVSGVQQWLRDLAFEGSMKVSPTVARAFGLTPSDERAAA